MRKLILTAVAVGVVGIGLQSAHAGDREWATVGKVLTGVAAGVIIAKAVDSSPACASVSYGYSAPGYSVSYVASPPPPCPPPPVVCAPAPVVIHQPVVYAPAPVVVTKPVFCMPSPTYTVTYSHPGRGHAYGHYKHRGHGQGHDKR
jgi:hypothetical protein